MTPEIMTGIIGLVGLIGAAFGYWRYFMGQIDSAKREALMRAESAAALASLAREELAAHRLHTAETYITKAGMREATESIMEAISGVKHAVDHMTVRVDRIVENQAKARTTRTG